MTRRTRMPSAGFVAVCGTFVAMLAFFAWGFRQPELDRVWWLHHELKVGAITDLAQDDQQLLRRNMRKHPELASALLGEVEVGLVSAHNWQGWLEVPGATLVRAADAQGCRKITLDVHTSPELLPFQIDFNGDDWNQKLEISGRGRQELELPPLGERSELVTVQFKGHDFPKDPAKIGVKLEVHCSGPAEASL